MAFSLILHSGRRAPALLDFGIVGLPAEITALKAGGLYVMRAFRSNLRRRLIVQTVLRSVALERNAAIVSADAAELLAALPEASRAEHGVRVFERPAHYREAMQRYGAEQFIREVEEIDLPPGSLLLVDGADDLFNTALPSASVDEALAYRRLMEDLDVIGIFVFQQAETLPPASQQLARSRPSLSGVASLNGELRRLSWDVDHWNSDNGTSRQRRFGIFLHEHPPWLMADGSEIDLFAERISGAADESSVFYTRASATGGNGLPAEWVPLDNYADVLPATEHTIGATIILHYAQPRDLNELARVIHALRLQCGRGVKILVRETAAHLRYHEELLMMRVGASAVVYRNQRLAQLLSAAESLRGHCYAEPIERDVDSATAELSPEQIRGYVSPRVFCGLVNATVKKTGGSPLRHVLLRLRIRKDKAHLDALTAWQLKRANDLVTADDKDVYLFLFGCREPDVDPTLERLLSVPAATLFSEQTRWQQPESINDEIRVLSDRAERQPFVDFSLLLPVSTRVPARKSDPTKPENKPGDVHSAMNPPPPVGPFPKSTSPSTGPRDIDHPAQPVGARSVIPIRLRVVGQSG